MKKILLLMVLLPSMLFAQTEKQEKEKKNELYLNAFEVIVGGVVPITYERFLTKNQSLAFRAFLLDKHYSDFNSNGDAYNTFSLQAQYVIYFSEKKNNAGFYAYPFLKYSGGNYNTYQYIYDPTNGMYIDTKLTKKQLNAAILGFGIGYKFVWKDKITIGMGGDLGRVLNNGNYYENRGPVDARFGINVGFRF